jgi:hypothetical protein
MTQKAHNLDHLRQCSEFVPHPGIGNPSFVSGKSVVIQGKTTRFGGFALGTA